MIRVIGETSAYGFAPVRTNRRAPKNRRLTTWIAEGQDIVKVKEAAGHSDIRTTMRYVHLSKEHLRTLAASPRAAKREAAS